MIIGELSRLGCSTSTARLFLEIKITQIEASVTLFAFVFLILQFLENDMFSIEMDMCLQLRLSMDLEKTLTFKISLEQIFTSSSVIEYL